MNIFMGKALFDESVRGRAPAGFYGEDIVLADADMEKLQAGYVLIGECGTTVQWNFSQGGLTKSQFHDTIIHPFLMEVGGKNRHLVKQALHVRAVWCLRETIRIAWCVFWLALAEYLRRKIPLRMWLKGENDA